MEQEAVNIRERRSIRSYRPDPVPPGLLREVLEEARWAPSAGNTQSTHVYVITGETLARVKTGLIERTEADAPGSPDIGSQPVWPEPYQGRFASLIKVRTEYAAAATADGVAATSAGTAPPPSPMVVMAGLFGAPALLVFAVDRAINREYGCFDAGLFVQSVALAAHARGLGTCIMTSTVRHADFLHEMLPASADQNLIAVMTVGYPNDEAPVNHFPRERIPTDDFVSFMQ